MLDEPTASLPGPDAQHLFDVLKRLRASGTSILYVSHRLNEFFGLVDKVTIFRDGRHVRSSDIRDSTPEAIVRDMLGHDLELHHNPRRRAASAPLLEVADLCTGDQGPLIFSVAAGEVVGLVGLRGAGHETIGRADFRRPAVKPAWCGSAGEIEPADLSIAERIAKGIALLSGDRLAESAIGGMTFRENLFPNASKRQAVLSTRSGRSRGRAS